MKLPLYIRIILIILIVTILHFVLSFLIYALNPIQSYTVVVLGLVITTHILGIFVLGIMAIIKILD